MVSHSVRIWTLPVAWTASNHENLYSRTGVDRTEAGSRRDLLSSEGDTFHMRKRGARTR